MIFCEFPTLLKVNPSLLELTPSLLSPDNFPDTAKAKTDGRTHQTDRFEVRVLPVTLGIKQVFSETLVALDSNQSVEAHLLTRCLEQIPFLSVLVIS